MHMIRKLLTPERGIVHVGADLICFESNTPFNPQSPPQIFLHVEGKETIPPSLPPPYCAKQNSC
jgi:hypothetical protein